MDDVVTGHFRRRAVNHDTFKGPVAAQDEIDHPGEVHDLGARAVGRGDQCPSGMGRIDHVHAVAFLDLFAGHADFFEDFVRGRADRGFVHEIAARPEASAQRQTLLDEDGFDPHPCQVVRADQPGRTAPDDNDVAFDELIELLVIFARNVARNVAFAQWRWFWFRHGGPS
jgi:hypothetical protein